MEIIDVAISILGCSIVYLFMKIKILESAIKAFPTPAELAKALTNLIKNSPIQQQYQNNIEQGQTDVDNFNSISSKSPIDTTNGNVGKPIKTYIG